MRAVALTKKGRRVNPRPTAEATAFTLAVALTQLCIYNFLGGPQGADGSCGSRGQRVGPWGLWILERLGKSNPFRILPDK